MLISGFFSQDRQYLEQIIPLKRNIERADYSPHSPIEITSDVQFTTEGFPGSGTSIDPYRIEHLNITNPDGTLISISHTTVHFKIFNNVLNGLTSASAGIFLHDVRNALIENNILINSEDGIRATGISDTHMMNNSISSNNRFGIFLELSTICNVSENTIHSNYINGIHLKSSWEIDINHNSLFDHQLGEYSQCGLLLDNSSNNSINYNSIYNNHYGLKFQTSSQKNSVRNNSIFNNQKKGLYLEYSSENMIEYNTIADNLLHGLLITVGSSDNIIRYNDFIKYNTGVIHALDNGTDNLFCGNKWDNFFTIDSDKNLIIDNPYMIDGIANNSDLYPLAVYTRNAINNVNKNSSSPGSSVFMFLLLIGISTTVGGGYLLYNNYLKNQRFEQDEGDEEFADFVGYDQIDQIKPLYHKIVVGLENVQTQLLPGQLDVPLLKPAETQTVIEYFPSEIKQDLRSGLKWRTILTLIEIAFQDPEETNPAKLAQSLNIPRSSLSNEIRRLIKLEYVESIATPKVLRDARFRSYKITVKGFKILYVLKETFKIAIARIKEKQEDFTYKSL
jgi:parallel beta-helix repeat protein